MTRTLTVNSNNDIFIALNGSLSVSDGLVAVMQAAQQSAQTQLGEMVFAVDDGIPNFATVWNGAPNVSQFEAYLRSAITAVDGVTSVDSLTTKVEGGALSYAATIQTIYGPGVLNG